MPRGPDFLHYLVIRTRKIRGVTWIFSACLACVLAGTLTDWGFIGRHGPHQNETAVGGFARSASSLSGSSSKSFEPVLLSSRPVYPYSIILGGVENAGELKSAVANDPVVARHYWDFNLSRTRVERLASDREMYVSYRVGDSVYWTAKKLILRKGESVLTDGANLARTRCGNRLSETPGAPVQLHAPPADLLETPPDPIFVAENEAPPGFAQFLSGLPPLPQTVGDIENVPVPTVLTPPTGAPVPPFAFAPALPPIIAGGGTSPPVVPVPPPVGTPE